MPVTLCPLRKFRKKNEDGSEYEEFMPCIGDKCAWWDERYGECAILSIAEGIGSEED